MVYIIRHGGRILATHIGVGTNGYVVNAHPFKNAEMADVLCRLTVKGYEVDEEQEEEEDETENLWHVLPYSPGSVQSNGLFCSAGWATKDPEAQAQLRYVTDLYQECDDTAIS